MAPRAKQDYPIQEDMAFQRRSWAIERAAWVAMGLAVVAALLGLLSHGPLSKTTAVAGNSQLSVTYQRLERREASSRFTIRVAQAGKGAETTVRLGPAFLQTYEVRTLTPAPLRSGAGANGFEGVFASAAAGDAEIHITGRAKRFGPARFALEALGIGTVDVRQFVFP